MLAAFNVPVALNSAFFKKAATLLFDKGVIYLETVCLEDNFDILTPATLIGQFLFSRNTLEGMLNTNGFSLSRIKSYGKRVRVLAVKHGGAVETQPFPLDDPRYMRSRIKIQRWGQTITRVAIRWPRKAWNLYTTDKPNFLINVARKLGASEDKISVLPYLGVSALNKSRQMVHIGVHVKENAGDTLLLAAIRRAIDLETGISHKWELSSVSSRVTNATITRWNRRTGGIVVGGGGLLIRDTNPNNVSGWNWNCPLPQLKEIEVPLFLFAIGYNRFPGQEDFDPIFKEHIQETIRRSSFFGLRNVGSIEKLSAYCDTEDLKAKLLYQPCLTTVLNHLYPHIPRTSDKKRLAVNVAFDRHWLRFKGQEQTVLTNIARAMKRASEQGWEILVPLHCPSDQNFLPWLMHERVPFQEVMLFSAAPEEIVRFYRGIQLAVGMRGHSQMIPFGCGSAIISLLSHEKLRYFLDDITHPEWGIDVLDPKLECLLGQKIEMVEQNFIDIQNQIYKIQDELWSISKQNLAKLAEVLQ